MNDKPILPLKCIFGCDDPVVVVVHTPEGCYCAGNKYQPRCMQHLLKLEGTNWGDFVIVEDFRQGDNWPGRDNGNTDGAVSLQVCAVPPRVDATRDGDATRETGQSDEWLSGVRPLLRDLAKL